MKTLKEVELRDKRVLLRADLDVPLDERGGIKDDARLKIAIPTIKYVLEKGAKQIVIMGHIDRPRGQVVDMLRMDRVAVRLIKLLGRQLTGIYMLTMPLPPATESKPACMQSQNTFLGALACR